MAFEKRAAVVGFCIRLHNYCVNARLELSEELKKKEGFIEVVPGLRRLAPQLNDEGAPVEHMTGNCRCQNCKHSVRSTESPDTSRRDELERDIIDEGLFRPYRRR